ncbi:MAG: phosphoenolpyruvate carboxylase [Polyangiaceae bacterium]|nr:phosphoenolpyruvate carboxylase [Polyangiaceae bacterium]
MRTERPDAPLRDDVRLLGELLGAVLRAHEGTALFDLVEEVRALAKRARGGNESDAAALRSRLAAIPAATAVPLARAFAHFLGLANVAEQHHRARKLATGERVLSRVVRAAREAGRTDTEIADALSTIAIELVLTAHPTQVVRRTVRMQHRAMHETLSLHDRATGRTRQVLERELARQVALLWNSDEVRRRKPTASDEVKAALVLFEQVLWEAVPRYLRVRDDVLDAHGIAIRDEIPIRFGSWVGGDRDGNPLVTAAVTREATLRARWTAARLWQSSLAALRDELSVVTATDELRALADGAREPYRVLAKGLIARFARTERWCEEALNELGAGKPEPSPPPDIILDPRDVEAVLDACDASLRAVGLSIVADGSLLDARRRARCFGVVLAPLDIRQDSGVHAAALTTITNALGLGSYSEWSEADRMAFLRRELASPRSLMPRRPIDDPAVVELMATLGVVRDGGPGAFGVYVISMSRAASDVLAVMLLQREARIETPLRVVPLFETLDDLAHAERVMSALLDEPSFVEQARGRVEVMVGYSDSTKDAGRMGSAWAIHKALEDVAALVRARGLSPVFFHGRGGTVGRGGSPIRDSILSLPPGTMESGFRVTVQGETIDATLGLETAAIESLDLYVASALEATLAPDAPLDPGWREAVEHLAADATRAYRAVVHDEPAFVPYFRAVTPERELGLLHAGSRPARRKGGDDVASLRAIPWVFAWNQVRFIIPAWLGVGEALSLAAHDVERAQKLRAMAKGWPFFRSLTGLVSMSLAKCDPQVLKMYEAQLVPEQLTPVGEALRRAFEGTKTAILHVLDQKELLSDDPLLQASVALRNPYIDPLNILQAELLRRLRAGDEDPAVREALLVTINGVAAGLRNTG